jgi:hypothetical protein
MVVFQERKWRVEDDSTEPTQGHHWLTEIGGLSLAQYIIDLPARHAVSLIIAKLLIMNTWAGQSPGHALARLGCRRLRVEVAEN